MLYAIPLPSSTLYLTIEEVQSLLETLEEILPHSDHFEVAGEFLSKEEMLALMKELKEAIWKWKQRERIPWESEGL